MKDKNNIPVISFIAAQSGSGKTTLLEKVITRLKADGYRVAVIKHTGGFEIDQPGKDSWRMTEAGADMVVISSAKKIAVLENIETEKEMEELIGLISDVDVILSEGFKEIGQPSIEVFRAQHCTQLCSQAAIQRLAIASDVRWDIGVPCYDIDDVEGVVSEIEKYIGNFHSGLPE